MPVIPKFWEAKAGGSPEVRNSRPAWPSETPSLLKNTKISQVWWHASVIPATQEAEAGEWHELRTCSLQWAEIVPLYSSPGNRARLCLKKQQKRILCISQAYRDHCKYKIKNNSILKFFSPNITWLLMCLFKWRMILTLFKCFFVWSAEITKMESP